MSQLGQDVQILKRYQTGFFVDVGAHDGISLSNTYLLEQHGWKGICVEPIPEMYERLCKHRTAICCNEAMYHTSDLEVTFDVAKESMLSGISEYIDCHKEIVDKDKNTIQVHTISMNDLLEKHNAPTFIEYLSLDTEGSEYEILKTVDFQKYSFGWIDVEHNFVEPRRSMIRELLTLNGYEFVKQNEWDDCYCKTQNYVATLLPGSALCSSILGVLFSLVYMKINNIQKELTINMDSASSVAKYFFKHNMTFKMDTCENSFELFYSPQLKLFELNDTIQFRYFEEHYEILKDIFDSFSIIPSNEPNEFTCLHIRRGDKLIHETQLKINSIDEYISKIEELHLQDTKLLIVTDQYDTYLECISKRPTWNISTTSTEKEKGFDIDTINHASEIDVQHEVERMLKDFEYIKNAHMFIGTKSSSVSYVSMLLRKNNTILLD
jgi:FkbM family methyltransferase